jgi:hypothetical protein
VAITHIAPDYATTGAPLVAFGPEHAWLCDAIALRRDDRQTPAVIAGPVHDGWIEGEGDGGSVMDGIDDRVGLHRVCYELAGSPELWKPADRVPDVPELSPYQQQLFEYAQLIADGDGWMLVDPRLPGGERSRARLANACAVYTGARPSSIPRPVGLGDMLRHMIDHEASRLELAPGQPPQFVQGGERAPASFPQLSVIDCARLTAAVMTGAQRDELSAHGRIELQFGIQSLGGFALTVWHAADGVHAVFVRRPR